MDLTVILEAFRQDITVVLGFYSNILSNFGIDTVQTSGYWDSLANRKRHLNKTNTCIY